MRLLPAGGGFFDATIQQISWLRHSGEILDGLRVSSMSRAHGSLATFTASLEAWASSSPSIALSTSCV